MQSPIHLIGARLGDLDPRRVTTRNVEAFRNYLLEERGLERITVARYLSTLRAGCGDELKHVRIGKMISELKRGTARAECWTREEVEAILKHALAMNKPLYLLLLFLFSTGCRRGEALALRRSDFNFDQRTVDVHRSLALDGSVKNGTKWGGARIVPMSKRLYQALVEWWDVQPNESSTADFVAAAFPHFTQRGLPIALREVCKAVGVRPLKLHCTRHTAISFALADGMKLRKASEIFGVSQQILEKHYAHHVPADTSMDWL